MSRFRFIIMVLGTLVALNPWGVFAQDQNGIPDPTVEPILPEPGVAGEDSLKPDLTKLGLAPEEMAGKTPEEALLLSVQKQMKGELQKLAEVDPDLPSLFFDQNQYKALRAAIKGFEQGRGGTTNVLEDEDLLAGIPTDQGTKTVEPVIPDLPSVDELTLGGIVYYGEEKWIIWLNGERVTPDKLPKQVKDIKVEKKYVEMKWFDSKSKKVIPVRLRPNQRFNIATRLFLPG